jgi:hypothetical protein
MGRIIKALLQGVGLGLVLVACSSFSYKWYVIDNSSARYNGPTAVDDLPFSRCDKVNGEYQCVMLTIDEFTRLRLDYDNIKKRLVSCESR